MIYPYHTGFALGVIRLKDLGMLQEQITTLALATQIASWFIRENGIDSGGENADSDSNKPYTWRSA